MKFKTTLQLNKCKSAVRAWIFPVWFCSIASCASTLKTTHTKREQRIKIVFMFYIRSKSQANRFQSPAIGSPPLFWWFWMVGVSWSHDRRHWNSIAMLGSFINDLQNFLVCIVKFHLCALFTNTWACAQPHTHTHMRHIYSILQTILCCF